MKSIRTSVLAVIATFCLAGPQLLTMFATMPLPPRERWTIRGIVLDSSNRPTSGQVYLVIKGPFSLDSGVAIQYWPGLATGDQQNDLVGSDGRFTLYGTSLSPPFVLQRGDSIGVMLDSPRTFGRFIEVSDTLFTDSSFVWYYSEPSSGGLSCLCSPTQSYVPVTDMNHVWNGYVIREY